MPLFADYGWRTGISSHCEPLLLHQVVLSFPTNLKSIICIPFLYLTVTCGTYSWWLSLHRACSLKTSRSLLVSRFFYIWHLSVSSGLHNSLNTFLFLAKALIPAICSYFWAFRFALCYFLPAIKAAALSWKPIFTSAHFQPSANRVASKSTHTVRLSVLLSSPKSLKQSFNYLTTMLLLTSNHAVPCNQYELWYEPFIPFRIGLSRFLLYLFQLLFTRLAI